jgi:hypothetical protein
MGTLEEVLEEAGFVVKQNRYLWQPPIKTNLNTAGISRSRYFELVKQV